MIHAREAPVNVSKVDISRKDIKIDRRSPIKQ
jgi:hypothetical protein